MTSSDAGHPIGKDDVYRHLCVMIHGFWGHPGHLNHLKDTILEAHPDAGIKVLVPASNKDNNTYDGIEVGGERITHEILQIVDDLRQKGHPLEKFSIVGYSLGGLIARYVVGLLYSDGFFSKVEAVNFTTFATPHLGVRSPKVGYQADTWNWLGSNLLSVSGQQLYLTDDFRGSSRPLLDLMADPGSIFVKGLQRFQKRSVYANIQHDPAVPYFSAAFDKYDPYVDLDAVDLHYLESTKEPQEVILDPDLPVTLKEEIQEQPQGWLSQWTPSERTRRSIPFYAFVASVLPIGLPIFLANAGYQTYQSSARVKLHESGSQVDLKRYRVPLFEETQKLQDEIIEGLASSSPEQFLPSTSREVDDKSSPDSVPWPTLALTAQQFSIVDHLDAVGFTKYPCYIEVRRAHAALIVRADNPTFVDGKIVCRHWADNFLP